MDSTEDLEKILSPLLAGMELSLVELSIGRHRGDVKVNLVLYKEGGIGLDDLTSAQKVLRPRLELEFDRDDLSLEISSPGMSRRIKKTQEYDIFRNRGIRILVGDDWIHGTNLGTENNELILKAQAGTERYAFSEIRKARLD